MDRIEYDTSVGRLYLIAEHGRLIRCGWSDNADASEVVRGVAKPEDKEVLERARRQLDAYFGGVLKCFDVPIRVSGTLFQKKVWECLSRIPYGSTVSYGALARMAGNEKAARAVARACGANPLAVIIPCHRVVACGGGIGGYTGGVDKKRMLLSLETGNRWDFGSKIKGSIGGCYLEEGT